MSITAFRRRSSRRGGGAGEGDGAFVAPAGVVVKVVVVVKPKYSPTTSAPGPQRPKPSTFDRFMWAWQTARRCWRTSRFFAR